MKPESAPAGRAGGAIPVVIPAYRPNADFSRFLKEVKKEALRPASIIVVDDGSGPLYGAIFAEAAAEAVVLRHAVNLGKGAALKTAFNYLLTRPGGAPLIGAVTADADGQHSPPDIKATMESLSLNPEALILGARTLDKDAPARSRFGAWATSLAVGLLLGRRLKDTQTGLRGVPAAFMPHLLPLRANGYDFEMDMLLLAADRLKIVESPISAIYLDGNRGSHFRPLWDSLKIYFVLLRYTANALLSAFIDYALFFLVHYWSKDILISFAAARAASCGLNFIVNKALVFKSGGPCAAELRRYLFLVLIMAAVSFTAISGLAAAGVPVAAAKLMVESILFIASFSVQRLFIFGRRI